MKLTITTKRLCEVCGEDISRAADRCTNGRCRRCHDQHCTPGGSTSPGHGRGKVYVSTPGERPAETPPLVAERLYLCAIYGQETRPRCYGVVGTVKAVGENPEPVPVSNYWHTWTARQQHVYHHARYWLVIAARNGTLAKAKAAQNLLYIRGKGPKPATAVDVVSSGKNTRA